MKYKILDLGKNPNYKNKDLYSAHIVINRAGVLEKNITEWSNEELHKITDGFIDLDRVNRIGRRRLLIKSN